MNIILTLIAFIFIVKTVLLNKETNRLLAENNKLNDQITTHLLRHSKAKSKKDKEKGIVDV